MQESKALTAGDYRFRFSSEGQLSETFDVKVHQGEEQQFDVTLGDRMLWQPLKIAQTFELIELDGGADISADRKRQS